MTERFSNGGRDPPGTQTSVSHFIRKERMP